jgi:hypothetical protein
MACQSCAERRAKMKAWVQQRLDRAAHWAQVRTPKAPEPAPLPEPEQDDEQP